MQVRAVAQVDRHVAGAGLGDDPDRHLVAGQLAAERGRLQQREAALAAAADVGGDAAPALRVAELLVDQVDQVVDVEQVAHLLARAAVADVGERAAEEVAEQPPGEDALVDLAHLPGPGDHAAAVGHRAQAEGVGVLLDQQLGGELGRAVEGAGAGQREVLGDARRPGPGDRLRGGQLEAGLRLLQLELRAAGATG